MIGILPGAGPKADEYVVIGAHHDHLGTTASGEGSSRASADDGAVIHNGADDNASGVAGVLELAKAFASGPRPARSIAFMTFTGEESGLIGSHHFVAHPVFPLEKTRMMVNLDMIGRIPENKEQVQVFGTKSAEEIEPVLTQMAERVGLSVKTAGGALGGSDQTSFYTKGVPVLHVFSGLHDEYHTSDDDAALINEQGAVRILELVHALASEFASLQTQLTYSRKAAEGLQRGPRGFKVVMGIMPSYTDSDEPGMEVVAVTRGRPAEAAGLLGG
ncbi:unnamed protein product, partial [marine sediment metagenome]